MNGTPRATGSLTTELERIVRIVPDPLLRRHLEMEVAKVRRAILETQSERQRLEEQNHFLLRLSRRDDLTGLANHAYVLERLDKEFERALRYEIPLSLLVADVDDFKRYNEQLGYLAGNEVLRRVARAIRRTVRTTDLAGRYGGDEFVVVLPHTPEETAGIVAERLRCVVRAVEEHPTISVGVASLAPPITRPRELLAEADRALAMAKEDGKDRVVAADVREARA